MKRALMLAVVAMLTSGCGSESAVPFLRSASAEDFTPLTYELTSDTYVQWLDAQENLEREAARGDLALPAQRILLSDPTPGAIDSVVRELQANERARRAIEAAGISVQDYVLATIAICQATDRPDTLGLNASGLRIPEGNIALVQRDAEWITQVRARSPARFIDERPRAKGGKGRGKGKGRGRR